MLFDSQPILEGKLTPFDTPPLLDLNHNPQQLKQSLKTVITSYINFYDNWLSSTGKVRANEYLKVIEPIQEGLFRKVYDDLCECLLKKQGPLHTSVKLRNRLLATLCYYLRIDDVIINLRVQCHLVRKPSMAKSDLDHIRAEAMRELLQEHILQLEQRERVTYSSDNLRRKTTS